MGLFVPVLQFVFRSNFIFLRNTFLEKTCAQRLARLHRQILVNR